MNVIQERDTLKGYFKTGAYPTQEQFELLIDSLAHRKDKIPAELISGLAELLNGKADISVSIQISNILKKIDDGELGGMTPQEKAQLERLNAMFEVDENRGWLRVKGLTKNYFMAMTELSKPNAPEVGTTIYYVVIGNASVAFTNKTAGATMKYSIDSGASWSDTNGTVTLASGYGNSTENAEKTIDLWVKAIKNGEESDTNKYTISIMPKVASGSVSVVRNGNNNDYSTSATITLTPSATTGSTSLYSSDSGSTWKALTETTEITVSSSCSANMYQIKATKPGYADATIAKNGAFTLNAKKAFYGFSTSASLSGVEEIQALASTGGSVENTVLSGALEVKPSGSAAGYIWLCCVGTLPKDNIVPNRGDVIPFGFEAASKVDGYNCYRSTNAINPVNTNVYIP